MSVDYKYQFFISSTYKDLMEERQIAINAIMKMGHIPAGMELFTATGEEQFESIKPIIDESDYYMLILGGKYGSVIEKEKVSYTEKEFDYALSTGKRMIALVYDDPDNLVSSKRETKSGMINRFKKFREKVISGRMVYMWNNLVDLSLGINSSISKAEKDFPASTCWKHIKSSMKDFDRMDDTICGKIEYINVYSKEQCAPYYRGIPVTLFDFEADEINKALFLKADFTSLTKSDDSYRWAGIYIRSLPCRDWRKYILNGSLLKFSAVATKNVKSMWLEIKSDRVEMCKRKIEFERDILKEYDVDLGQYNKTIEDWKFVREICFVIYPEYCEDEKINIEINSLRIES